MKITINNFYLGDPMSEIKQQITALAAAVAAQTTVTTSAITLINGLSESLKTATVKLAEAGADTAELVEITNHITTESSALAAAIEQNTTSSAPQETLAVSEIAADTAAESSSNDTAATTENVADTSNDVTN